MHFRWRVEFKKTDLFVGVTWMKWSRGFEIWFYPLPGLRLHLSWNDSLLGKL